MSKTYFEEKAKAIGFKRPKNKFKKLNILLPQFCFLFWPIILVYQYILKKQNKIIIFREYPAIGDVLVLTNFVRFINNKFPNAKIKVITRYPEIFYNNPLIYSNLNFNKYNFVQKVFSILFFRSAAIFKLSNLIYFDSNCTEQLYALQTKEHLLCRLTRNYKYNKEIIKFPKKCEIYFSSKELKGFSKKYDNLPKNYYLILSEVTNHMHTKNWGFENMQNLVNQMPEINWVQVGTLRERELINVKSDLRGKTNLRELFYIVRNCEAIVCTEGMYVHLSSAFDKKCFTILSGALPVELSLYPNIYPITKNPQVSCANCWLDNCPFFNNPKCLSEVSVKQVRCKIKELM